jgi:hypothetical protein
MSIYTILHLGLALAKDIQTILVMRFLGGFFGVAPPVNAGGTSLLLSPCRNGSPKVIHIGLIADIWNAEKRGTAVSLFTLGVFVGPGESESLIYFVVYPLT